MNRNKTSRWSREKQIKVPVLETWEGDIGEFSFNLTFTPFFVNHRQGIQIWNFVQNHGWSGNSSSIQPDFPCVLPAHLDQHFPAVSVTVNCHSPSPQVTTSNRVFRYAPVVYFRAVSKCSLLIASWKNKFTLWFEGVRLGIVLLCICLRVTL